MNPENRQLGVTLVELMIAMVLGLVLIIAIGSIFVGSRQTYLTQQAFSQMQENGRFAHYMLNNVIRLAGYVPVPREHTDPAAIFSSDDRRAIRGWESEAPDLPGIASASDAFDAISVTYAGAVDGAINDCFGGAVPYSNDPAGCAADADNPGCQLATNTLYLDDEIPTSMMCKITRYNCDGGLVNCALGTDPPPQPLFRGVADLQFRYGIDTNNDLAVDQWVNADAVPNWNRVLAVEATVIAESEDAVERGPSDDELVVEGRLRRPFTITIAIRNRLTP